MNTPVAITIAAILILAAWLIGGTIVDLRRARREADDERRTYCRDFDEARRTYDRELRQHLMEIYQRVLRLEQKERRDG